MPTLPLVQTSRFGGLEMPENARLRLLRPLAGFPNTAALFRIALPRQAPVFWLQSVEEPEVAFACAPVPLLRPGYRLSLAAWDREIWGGGEAEAVALLSFKGGTTANLAAPVLLDFGRRTALQVLNQAAGWGLAEPLAGA